MVRGDSVDEGVMEGVDLGLQIRADIVRQRLERVAVDALRSHK
jgi:hypothetical protein